MTKNFHRDAPPTAGTVWASAACTPGGQFGVAIGIDDVQIAFIREDYVAHFVGAELKAPDDCYELLALAADAAATLKQFKLR